MLLRIRVLLVIDQANLANQIEGKKTLPCILSNSRDLVNCMNHMKLWGEGLQRRGEVEGDGE